MPFPKSTTLNSINPIQALFSLNLLLSQQAEKVDATPTPTPFPSASPTSAAEEGDSSGGLFVIAPAAAMLVTFGCFLYMILSNRNASSGSEESQLLLPSGGPLGATTTITTTNPNSSNVSDSTLTLKSG